jgi:hypothetical protein
MLNFTRSASARPDPTGTFSIWPASTLYYDPTRPVTSLKTAWKNLRKKAKVEGRWQTIMDIAGHVSKQMLKHYSHIRMEAKRTALESIATGRNRTAAQEQKDSAVTPRAQECEGVCPQKSAQSDKSTNY